LPQIVARRCQFIIEENNRVLELMNALPRGEKQAVQHLFQASYVGARNLYEISAPAMEAMMDAMEQGPGVVAARQTGAGFGGCLVALVEALYVQQFISHVTAAYAAKTNVWPSMYSVVAAPGAGVLNT
jgi:galactokinase